MKGTYTLDKWIVWLFVISWACLMAAAIGQWFT